MEAEEAEVRQFGGDSRMVVGAIAEQLARHLLRVMDTWGRIRWTVGEWWGQEGQKTESDGGKLRLKKDKRT